MKKILILFLILSNFSFGTEEIRIRKKQSSEEANHDYCLALLEIALKNTEKEYGKVIIKSVDMQITQGRSLEALEQGKIIDIDWAATSIEREEKLTAIKIPLFKGLLGYRVPVIDKKNTKYFDKIKTIGELKKMSVVQGTHWPDTEILEYSGFNVIKTPKFENMYALLESGRTDYFLRSMGEAYGEVKARGNKDLIVYDKIIVAYKSPMYFFVNKKNTPLAERVKKGLLIAIENGEFLNFMKNHPLTKPIFPLEKYKKSLIFEIENPILPKDTPINDKTLWIDFN